MNGLSHIRNPIRDAEDEAVRKGHFKEFVDVLELHFLLIFDEIEGRELKGNITLLSTSVPSGRWFNEWARITTCRAVNRIEGTSDIVGCLFMFEGVSIITIWEDYLFAPALSGGRAQSSAVSVQAVPDPTNVGPCLKECGLKMPRVWIANAGLLISDTKYEETVLKK